MTVECGSSFSDPGAAAYDICSGEFMASPSGTVDVYVLGTYTITYIAVDGAGNRATATRTVTVVDTTPPELEIIGSASVTVECKDDLYGSGSDSE